MRDLLSSNDWLVIENGFDPAQANVYETLFTVGNGYQAVRGSFEESHAGELSGAYVAGIYDSYDAPVIDLVNAPSWIDLAVWVGGVRLDLDGCQTVDHERILDLRQGLLYRRTVLRDDAGRSTQLESIRLCSLADRHLCGLRLRVTPIDYSAPVTIVSGVDGERRNLDRRPVYDKAYLFDTETKWQKWAKSIHLRTQETADAGQGITLTTRTIASCHSLAYASAINLNGASRRRRVMRTRDRVDEIFDVELGRGQTIAVDKFVVVQTSRDSSDGDLRQLAIERLRRHRDGGFDAAFKASASAWLQKWESCDCVIEGKPELTRAARFNIYHLLITANEEDPKVNIGAKALTGEGYRGHVFWDTEIFMLPFYIFTQPQTAKALLLYRYHCLGAAIENARANGLSGAQYPWEAADTGQEVTPKWTPDGLQRIWTGEEEIHVSADVAYGIISYVEATGDFDFLRDYGAEVLFQTSRFWASRLEWSEERKRYELNRVIGPDEFHEHVDNNAFTNRMAQWHLVKSADVFDELARRAPAAFADLCARLSINRREIELWRATAAKIYIPYDATRELIEEFQGYFQLRDVPIAEWDENDMPVYPEGLDHFTCNGTMLVKQPDVVMLLHVLPDEFSDEIKRKNYEFYEKRTMHKSSLSPAIHAIFGLQVGHNAKALQYFARSAFVDLQNNQGNTQDGVHAASAAGTWQALVFGFGGFRVRNEQMSFRPSLPDGWSGLRFELKWRGRSVAVAIRPKVIELRLVGDGPAETVAIFGASRQLQPGAVLEHRYGA